MSALDRVISLLIALALVGLVTGCGDSSGTESANEAGRVAIAYTGAMSRLDFRTACELEFTALRNWDKSGIFLGSRPQQCKAPRFPVIPQRSFCVTPRTARTGRSGCDAKEITGWSTGSKSAN